MKRFLSPKGLIGLALIILVILAAVLAPLVLPADFATRTRTPRLCGSALN